MAVNPDDISALAEEILADIELGRVTLAAATLKCARLARWIGDDQHRKIFSYEAGGYPTTPSGIPPDVFELGRLAGRVELLKAEKGKETVERMSTQSVDAWEQRVATNRIALAAATDRDVSISSANPNQTVFAPMGNGFERKRLAEESATDTRYLARSRAYAYEYANAALHQSRFSNAAATIFDRIRERVDVEILTTAPKAAQKVAAIQDNLRSANPEDWANAVHSCRRLLQDIAEVLFPPTEPQKRHGKTIVLGPDNYINRLVCFVEDRSDSNRFIEIVGSTLGYIGERLDAVFKAAQKGSHGEIASREEAERYVIYTFLTVADLLTLNVAANDVPQNAQEKTAVE